LRTEEKRGRGKGRGESVGGTPSPFLHSPVSTSPRAKKEKKGEGTVLSFNSTVVSPTGGEGEKSALSGGERGERKGTTVYSDSKASFN